MLRYTEKLMLNLHLMKYSERKISVYPSFKSSLLCTSNQGSVKKTCLGCLGFFIFFCFFVCLFVFDKDKTPFLLSINVLVSNIAKEILEIWSSCETLK